MREILCMISLVLSLSLIGQITDDFSDGDFTTNPAWSGTSTFGTDDAFDIVEADNQLRSQDLNSGSGTRRSYLSTPNSLDLSSSSAEWAFRMRIAFSQPGSASTNSNNTSRVYLMSNSSDLNGDVNGYYVELRYPDSDVNEVRLYRQDAGTSTELTLSGTIQQLTSQAFVDVAVSRSELGIWEVEVNSTSQGNSTDNTYNSATHFGLQIRYTANTRDNGFYFDDFGGTVTPVADTDPPIIQSVTAISETAVEVQFDEDVDLTTAQNIGNYALDGSVSISNAVLDGADNSLVHLTTSALTNGSTYNITINNVEDLSGNIIVSDSQDSFQYLVFEEAVAFDVVINEFMPDPNPVVTTLPDAEYIELYNRSNKYFNLQNWTLDGQSLPTFTLAPDAYVIVVEDDDVGLFGAFTDVIVITTLSLNNTSLDNIVLVDDNATEIHSKSFEGSTGGISAELINPNGPDYSDNNYGLSIDPDGGTPGEPNSIFDDTPDTTPPTIGSVAVVSNTELAITFSEVLDQTSAENIANYSIDGSISVISATLDILVNQLVHLVVEPLVSGENRTLSVNGVQDLSGNVSSDAEQFEYIETEEALIGDVLINEFLSNPVNNNDDFIELYNNSNKFIDMVGWNISDESSTSEDLPSFILRPEEYLIIYDEDASIDYSAFGNTLSIASLTLNNSDDQIEITSASDVQIAFLAYEEGQDDGISMELINPNDPCLALDSYLPSVDISGSTPGRVNSVFNDSPDTESPIVQSYNFSTNLIINFSEVMDAVSLASGTYSISNGVTINQVNVVGEFPTAIEISFNQTIEAGVLYDFTLSNVTDCAGNEILETTIPFGVGRAPSFNELIITEIMFDPDPQVELPNREFVEIYNATTDILSIAGISFTDASSTVSLPASMLNPGEYYVLTTTSAASEFSGNVIGVSGFPSLNNSGEQLIISMNDELIFSLKYDPSWHSEDKASGGYSLEMRDITNPCLEDGNNWVSSQNIGGGTPGMINSVSEVIPDNFGPEIVSAIAISSDSILVLFDEKIDPESVNSVVATLDPSVDVEQILFNVNNPTAISISLSSDLEQSIAYSLIITNVIDCVSNQIQPGEAVFALPVQADVEDIKLSEVLFNPRSNGVDFVEVYNDSEKYISLKNWKLGNLDEEGNVDDIDVITTNELVIAPNEYLVFTTDKNILLSNYPKGSSVNFFEVTTIPSYPNDQGTVLLIDQSETVVETFTYTDDYHYNLLESVDGVSLERVSFEESTNNGNNWRSASSTEGFATPGYANSQSFKNDTPVGRVTASPEVFIPGNTGSGRDFTTINYQFDQPGQFANVNIYDQTGRLVKHLAQGVLLSTSGFLRWDGDTNDGKTARMGYHLIIFEIYDSSGNSEIIKETVVVGRDF
ncbi:lamin tail domain-containing protein [Ekhidna sp.]|uniref:lamin tail domain-containing protein n=1 Tax=Ekhidna sp. TaxID=2608089 RepID=UPI00329A2830